jgi:hypothetical protein
MMAASRRGKSLPRGKTKRESENVRAHYRTIPYHRTLCKQYDTFRGVGYPTELNFGRTLL